MGRGLQQAEMKGDRRLVEYQKKYEQKIQFLMNKLRDAEANEAPDERIRFVGQLQKMMGLPGAITLIGSSVQTTISSLSRTH